MLAKIGCAELQGDIHHALRQNGKFFVSTGDQLFTGTHLGKTYVNGRAYGVGENDMMRLTRRLEETRREEERKKRAEEERKKKAENENKNSNHTPLIHTTNDWLKTGMRISWLIEPCQAFTLRGLEGVFHG